VPFGLTSLVATANEGMLTLIWEPADERPVVGWHVDRIGAGPRERLTATPLAGAARRAELPVTGDPNGDVFRLLAVHPYGVTSEAGETALTDAGQTRLALYPAHPNPAPGTTAIGFALPRQANVRLRVYDVAGRLVRTLVDGQVAAGEGVKIWDGRNNEGGLAAGGMYFYRLETDNGTLTRKLILVR